MLIAQISDTHILPPDPNEPTSADRVRALTDFVQHINGLAEKPDLVLHTGDVTHGGKPEYYEIVHGIMSALHVPVFFATGNRDLPDNLVAGLKDLGGASTTDGFLIYSVDGFPVRLIAMDTRHQESNIGTTCAIRLAALDALLSERPETPTALFMHHPPFEITTSKYPFQFDDKALAEQFLGLIAHHKQVVHMFCGHAHRAFSVDLQTCVATVVPSLPVDNRLGEFAPDMATRPLYQLHRWHPDTGRFQTTLHAATI